MSRPASVLGESLKQSAPDALLESDIKNNKHRIDFKITGNLIFNTGPPARFFLFCE